MLTHTSFSIHQGCIEGKLSHLPTADTYDSLLTSAVTMSDKFTGLNVDDLDAACAGDAPTILSEAADVTEQLTTLSGDYSAIYDSISCETMATMVQKAVYENSCHSLTKGLIWTFSSTIAVAGFGSILLTLRSATTRPQIYLVPAGQDDNNSYIIDDDADSYDRY